MVLEGEAVPLDLTVPGEFDGDEDTERYRASGRVYAPEIYPF